MRGGGITQTSRKFPPLTLALSPHAERGDAVALAARAKS